MRTDLALGHALRSLRARPAFNLLSAVVLAVGVAGVATIAGLVGSLLLRPLPYARADRLVFVLGGDGSGGGQGSLQPAELAHVRAEARSFEHLAALTADDAVVGSGADARPGRGLRVSPDLAATLGVGTRAGRLLTPADEEAGAIVLGESFWREAFATAGEAVGATVLIDGLPRPVVGVLATEARLKPILGFEPDWWRALPSPGPRAAPSPLLAIARLRDGVALGSAQAELSLIARRLGGTAPSGERTLSVTGLRAGVDPVARVLVVLVLAALVGIVCLDVGSLLLASVLAREREVAVRQALGASRGDVFLELLLHGLLLGIVAGGLGLLLAFGGGRAIARLAAGTNAEALAVEVDGWLCGVAFGVALLAGTLAGLAPALHARAVSTTALLSEGSPTSTASPRARRGRALLVGLQVAVSLALLSQAGLALFSLRRLLSVERGFSARGALAVPFEVRRADGDALVSTRARGLPGVSNAALGSSLPAGGPLQPFRVSVAGRAGSSGERARVAAVSAGYAEALGLTLRSGRWFSDVDDATAPAIAVVNECLASREGLGAGALGAVVEVDGVRRTIVGIAGDVRNPPLQAASRPEIYLPWKQATPSQGWLLVKTALDRPLRLAASLSTLLDSEPAVRRRGRVRELDRALAADMGVIRLGTALLAAVALGAAVLTIAGTFGVVSFLAGRRRREIGIRLSLGAPPAGLLRLVLLQELRPVLGGVAAGALVSLALGRVLASRVHGLRPLEPLPLLAAVLLFSVVLGLACYLPARRATRVDPVAALRCE